MPAPSTTHTSPTVSDPEPIEPQRSRVDRRTLLRRGTALGAGLVGTGAIVRLGLAAQEQGATPMATASAGTSTTPQIVSAANAYLATLDATQRASALFTYPVDQTVATATDFSGRVGEQFGDAVWSNYPISDVIRPGMRLGDLSEAQRTAAMTLMASALSEQGYQKIVNIMEADQVLSEGGTNYASGRDNYVLGIFGEPSESDPWMVQFGGHHLAINITIEGDEQGLAPMLTGCQPSEFSDANGTTVRPLGAETDDGFALINALDADQQAQAILSYSQGDLVLGPGHDGQVLQPEGIVAADLDANQQALLITLIGNWVTIINDFASQTILAEIESNLPETYFAWSGDTTPGSASYFRITGPTIVIEFAPQGTMGGGPGGSGGGQGTPQAGGGPGGPGGQGTPVAGSSGQFQGGQNANATPSAGGTGGDANPYETGGANHIHTIYRDPTNEYGTGFDS